MKNFSKLKAGVAPAALGLAMIAMPAFAQDAPAKPQAAAADDAPPEQQIVVTGSLIRNPNIVSSSPVAVVNSEEIKLRQVNNAEEVLRGIPGAVPNVGQNVNNGNNGASYVDLRGLGSQRNLVLLDGTRLVPSNNAGRVDLNNIPLALIERVDALTGGASTTYGADAVSGVVNFITKKHFNGVEIDAGEAINQMGDGNAYHAAMTVGGDFADGKGNAVISIGIQKQDPVSYGDRGFSRFSVSSTSGVASGASPTSTPTTVSFDDGSTLQVAQDGSKLVAPYAPFNFNPYNVFVTPSKRYNIYGAGNYEVADSVELYMRGMFSRNTVSTIVAPSGLFGDGVTIPANNPYLNPAIRDQICTAEGIALGAACNTNPALPLPAVYRRAIEVGPRIDQYRTDFFDYKAGLRGNITSKISYDVYGSYGESTNTQTRLNYTSLTRIQNALNATNTTTCLGSNPGCVPLNLLGAAGSITPAQAAYIGGVTSTISFDQSLVQVHGSVSAELFTLPSTSKPVIVALGGEYRKYTGSNSPDFLAQQPGELGGAGGAILPVSGGYDVREAFGELNLPLVSDKPLFHDLTAEAGFRQSHYTVKTAGSPSYNATTYKGGLSWSPVAELKLRGTYSRAVRAPNIGELFAPSSTGLTNLTIDPCSGSKPVGNAALSAVCIAQGAPANLVAQGLIQDPAAGQANSYGGGNPKLTPEVADSYTIGAVLRPASLIPNFTLTVDYYNIIINKAVTTPTPGDVINACFANITAASATSAACTGIRRSTVSGRLSGSTATVPGLPTPLSNLGRLATDGVDISANYNHQFGQVKLVLSFDGNWTNHSKFQATPTSINRECVGYYSANCASIQPRWQWNQRTSLVYGKADFSLLWRHISAVRYEPILKPLFSGTIKNAAGINSDLAGQTVDFNRIKAFDYFDFSTRFSPTDNFELTITVANLFNRKPPVLGATAGSTSFNAGNTYPSTYDAVGRRFAVSGTVKF